MRYNAIYRVIIKNDIADFNPGNNQEQIFVTTRFIAL
jgi:hypothetical protein